MVIRTMPECYRLYTQVWSQPPVTSAFVGGERLESFHLKMKFVRQPDLSAF